MSVNRKKKVTRITLLNSAEVAMSQPRISEFLSDNASKDSTRPSAPSSPDAEKTSNLSPQVEKVPLLKESISEVEGTAKVTWSVVKPNTTSTSLSLRIQAIPRILLARLRRSREKLRKKKQKRREKKRVMKGLAGMSLADLDQEFSDHSSCQTKRARESSIFYPLQQTSCRSADDMKSLMMCKKAKPRKRWLAQAPQLVMLGL